MALVGYARVSTTDQNYSIQEEALKNAGCIKIFAEKKSGASKDDRKEFNAEHQRGQALNLEFKDRVNLRGQVLPIAFFI